MIAAAVEQRQIVGAIAAIIWAISRMPKPVRDRPGNRPVIKAYSAAPDRVLGFLVGALTFAAYLFRYGVALVLAVWIGTRF